MAASRPIREVPHYGVGLDAIRAELTAGPVAAFLDFDGTLARVVARRDQAAATHDMLEAVARMTLVAPVTIMSGRDTTDLARLVDVIGVTLAGGNGFDVLHPDGRRERFGPPGLDEVLDRAEQRLRAGTTNDPGVEVARKDHGIAVLTRGAADEHARIAAEVLAHRVADEEDELRAVDGRRLVELVPAHDWHRGRAVAHLLEQLGGEHVPVVVGDDVRDEDAFELPNAGRGVSIVVRGEDDWRPTVADWSADDPEDVRRLLQQLAALLGA